MTFEFGVCFWEPKIEEIQIFPMDGVYGPLYSYGVKVLKLYRPQWFLAENVGGLKTANDGKAFTKILEEMRSAGYKLYPNLYKFETYGIRQARHRIIIVGIRNDLDFEFKIPSNAPYKDVDNSCKTAIEVPPIPANASVGGTFLLYPFPLLSIPEHLYLFRKFPSLLTLFIEVRILFYPISFM